MPEGDTIAYAARRMRPVLEGHVPEEIRTPHPRHRLDRWPERLRGRAVTDIRTHGKHLFLRFEGNLTIHSHLRMTGSWGVYASGAGLRPTSRAGSPEWAGPAASSRGWRRSANRAWLVLTRASHEVVQFDGPVLELLTDSRTRFDQRLAALGPDILAPEFEYGRFLARLRADDPTRGIADALLDQRNVAGIGNLWKSEGCWDAAIDPWRQVSQISDEEAQAIIDRLRPRMFESARTGDQSAGRRAFRRNGESCSRCGTTIRARGQGEENRTTFWCPGCQR
jgi:endonuclease-8